MTQNELFCPYSLLHRSLLSCFSLLSAAMSVFSQVSPFFYHCCLCIWNFHGLRHRNKFVHKILVTQWIDASLCDAVFMVLALRPFHAYPQRFVGLNNTSIFRLVLSNCATGLPVLKKLKSTKHRCWHRNFQLSTSIFIVRFNSSSWGFEVVCFLVRLSPNHVYPSSGFSFNTVNLVKPVNVSDNFLPPSTFH